MLSTTQSETSTIPSTTHSAISTIPPTTSTTQSATSVPPRTLQSQPPTTLPTTTLWSTYKYLLGPGLLVLSFTLAVIACVFAAVTRRRYQQLLTQRGPSVAPETENNEYEEWNESWKMQPVITGSEQHSLNVSSLTVTPHRSGSTHDSENSLYGVI
nr:uncharacterized protein LOC128688929 [Cherax quadricarinatus]